MNLTAIYNIWDGVERLHDSIESIKDGVDNFIFAIQTISNAGEVDDPSEDVFCAAYLSKLHNFQVITYRPDLNVSAGTNEIKKRHWALKYARENVEGMSHFLHIDTDECYPNFKEMKEEFMNSRADGSVANIVTYFKSKDLRFEGYDDYYVPFIHKLSKQSFGQYAAKYPFYVDPTRRTNDKNIVLIKGGAMHHYSWVRDDIMKKANNSSAKSNIFAGTLLEYYNDQNTGEGTIINGRKLIKATK